MKTSPPKGLYSIRNFEIATIKNRISRVPVIKNKGGYFMKQSLSYAVWSTIIILFACAFAVPAVQADSPNYDITKVEIDDIELTGLTYDIERDQDLTIEVFVTGASNISGEFVDNVRVQAEIIGYEFGPISDITPLFSIDQGVTYKKVLRLHVPHDIDASQTYTLRIRVSDKIDEEEEIITLNIDEQRHALNIFAALLSPTTVQAGKPVLVTVNVENLGEKQEDQIIVTASIPQLGISNSGIIGELVTQQQEKREEFFKEQISEQIQLLLRIPEDAASGQYTVQIDVNYNRGHSQVSQTKVLTVQALPKAVGVETIINPETTSKTAAIGEEVAYRVMVANLGTDKGVYSIQLDGVQWAEARVEPGFLTVLPDSTGQFTVFITPLAGIDARTYTFNARVLQGNDVVSDVILQTKVEASVAAAAGPTTFKTVLAIIFGILVLVLIVLGIIVATKRATEEQEGAPGAVEGQTYYYSPKR